MKKIGNKSAIQQAIIEAQSSANLEEGEITIYDFMKMCGKDIDRQRAVRLLDSYVRNGKLAKRKVMVDGRYCNAYKEL